jgi:hypothetical protein
MLTLDDHHTLHLPIYALLGGFAADKQRFATLRLPFIGRALHRL